MMKRFVLTGFAILALAAPGLARAEDAPDASAQELAKKLSNPVASLISVPLQFNYDCCFGPSEGGRYVLNVQPVIPVKLNDNWNLIVRTIIPIIDQDRTTPTRGAISGVGDVTQTFFVSPQKANGGIVWAVGPVFLWPTGQSGLSGEQWGAGPSALVLKQSKGWSYGILANHIWSYAQVGSSNAPPISATYIQPFLSWTNRFATTVSLNTESTYNWQTNQWSVPINMAVSHVYKFGDQRVSLGGGIRVYAARDSSNGSSSGPDWGARFTATFLYPK